MTIKIQRERKRRKRNKKRKSSRRNNKIEMWTKQTIKEREKEIPSQ